MQHQNRINTSTLLKQLWLYIVTNKFVFIHLTVWLCAYLIMGFLNIVKEIPDNRNILEWDANWYRSIRDNGYQYIDGQQSNIAFFPFFSYIWKLSTLNNIKMATLNWLFCFFAFTLLKKSFKLKTSEVLLFLSLPSMMFMYTPYSESLFFLFSVIFLIGLYEGKSAWILTGIFVSSLIRPTAVFYIPAIIFMQLICSGENLKDKLKKAGIYSVMSVLALCIVIVFQWFVTGKWFIYFEAQTQFWKHHFTLPRIPFTTWDEAKLLWLDGLAFCFGLTALIFSVVWGIRWLFKKTSVKDSPHSIVLFSSAFLSLTTFYVVFFDSREVTTGTTLLSLNRYIFASPFFIIFLWHFIKPLQRTKELAGILLAATIIGLYLLYPLEDFEALKLHKLKENKTLLYFMVLTLYMGTYPLMKIKSLRYELITGIYCLNMLLQIYIFNDYLAAWWIG